jgi:hypothetical protein
LVLQLALAVAILPALGGAPARTSTGAAAHGPEAAAWDGANLASLAIVAKPTQSLQRIFDRAKAPTTVGQMPMLLIAAALLASVLFLWSPALVSAPARRRLTNRDPPRSV